MPFLNFRLLTLVLFSISLTGLAQTKTGSIHGKVINEHNEPVEFATIFLKGTNYSIETDVKGVFSLNDIPTGNYTLLIALIGHQEISQEITVSAGQTLELNQLTLPTNGEVVEVEVKGKTESQKIKEQGFQVNVIDLKSQYNTTADINQVLNRTAGVRVREEGGLGSNFTFSLNGFTGNQVKFFLDGIPMDRFGSSLTLNNFPVNLAERIEVYKGVIPVSLGTDALGGAINIIPRKNPNYLDVSYSYGSFNTHRAAISGTYTNEKSGLTVNLNTFYNYSDNNYKVLVQYKELPANNTPSKEAYWFRRFHDSYQSATMQLEAGVTGKKYADRLLFGIIASGNDKDIQNGVVMEEVYGAITSRTRALIPTLKYKKTNLFIKGLELNLYSAYNMNDFQRIDTTNRKYNWKGESVNNNLNLGAEINRTINKNTEREFLTNANLNYKLTPSQTIAFNYLLTAYKRTSFDAMNPDLPANRLPANLNKHVFGLGWTLQVRKRFNASVFGKLYHMKSIGRQAVGGFGNTTYEPIDFSYTNPGYGVATAYFIYTDLQIKASYERAYRLPESGEIFGDGLFMGYAVALKPEQSDNINLALRYSKTLAEKHRVTFEVGCIYRHTVDFIRTEQVPGAGNRNAINMGKVITKGVEAELSYAFKKLFNLSVNGTYQSLIDMAEYQVNQGYPSGNGASIKNFYYGFALPNIPYLFGNATAGVNIPIKNNNLSFTYSLNYVHEFYIVPADFGNMKYNEKYVIPEQIAHNAYLTYSMKNGRYNISLECRNMTDNLLYDSFKLQKPGRSFAVKLRYFISK